MKERKNSQVYLYIVLDFTYIGKLGLCTLRSHTTKRHTFLKLRNYCPYAPPPLLKLRSWCLSAPLHSFGQSECAPPLG